MADESDRLAAGMRNRDGKVGHQRQQVGPPIRPGTQDDGSHCEGGKVLLEQPVAINCQEHAETLCCESQQLTVDHRVLTNVAQPICRVVMTCLLHEAKHTATTQAARLSFGTLSGTEHRPASAAAGERVRSAPWAA